MKKDKKGLTEHCSKCKHDHVAKTGPCLKLGCGCNHLYDEAHKASKKEKKKK